jgi:hypothetical protein
VKQETLSPNLKKRQHEEQTQFPSPISNEKKFLGPVTKKRRGLSSNDGHAPIYKDKFHSPFCPPFFKNNYAKNYEKFCAFIRDEVETNQRGPQIDGLFGNISNDPGEYFIPTEQVKNNAEYFLHCFWNEKDNYQAILRHHMDKVKGQGKNQAYPGCISFLRLNEGVKETCYVALSGWKDTSNLIERLQLTAKRLNRINEDGQGIDFQIITNDGSNDGANFRRLLKNVSAMLGIEVLREPMCSEKILIPVVAKQIPRPAFVTGAVNCRILRYQSGIGYGRNAPPYSLESFIAPPPLKSEKINIGRSREYISLVPCCSTCKNLKRSVLTILDAADKYRRKNNNEWVMSPLRNNFS